MSSEARTVAEPEVIEPSDASLPAPHDVVFRFRQDIIEGVHWFEALVDAVGRWRVPFEVFDGRQYAYLVDGEAFDWLVLAERLLEEADDLVPEADIEALLFEGTWPLDMDEADFASRIGQAKHRAHLNYLYGVLVEEALQLSVEEEIHKENFHRPWGQDRRYDESAFERIYGITRDEAVEEYREETGRVLPERVGYQAWKAFTYFLFKRRLKGQDPARVASDTRKGLAQLSRMEMAVGERRAAQRSRGIAAAAAEAAGSQR